MRRPLIGIASGVALGTWLGLTVDACGSVWPGAVVFAAGCLFFHLTRREWAADAALYILVVLMTWGFSSRSGELKIVSLMDQQGWNGGRLAEISGNISSDITDSTSVGGRAMVRFSMRVDRVSVDGVQYRVDDAVLVDMYGAPRYPPVYGETWQMKGRLFPLRKSRRFGYVRYGFKTGLRNSRCIKESQSLFLAWGHAGRKQIAKKLAAGIEKYPEVTGVIHAMMLGYRSHLPDDVRDCFRHTGTMHIFAISGLHVGILCSIIVFALAVLGVPRSMWVLGLAPLLVIYTMVTGARASAIRAGVMAIAYLLAPLMRRRADAVSAFAFAAAAILLWNPEQLIDVGFIYSFAVVAGIMAIVPVFDVMLETVLKQDEFVLPEQAAKSQWWRSAIRLTVRMFAVSLAAWMTSTPLSLHFFGRFSPVALLGNLIAVPLAFFVLVTGSLSILTGTLIGGVGEIFNSANWVFVKMLVSGMKMLERIPYGWIDCGHMPLRGVFVWYAVLMTAVVVVRRLQQIKRESQKNAADDLA